MNWITNDKREIRIADMGDDHLVNTLSMIERELSAGCSPIGHLRLYPALVKEAMRREVFEWNSNRKYLKQSTASAAAHIATTKKQGRKRK